MLHKRLIIDGKEFPLAAAQSGRGSPCDTTPGCVGVTYMDEETGKMYKCIKCADDCTEWEPIAGDTELEERVETLEEQLANLLYTPISITSFSHNTGVKEKGETITSVNLTWEINKTPVTLTLDGVKLDVNDRAEPKTGLSITKDNANSVKWKLAATDERGTVAERSTPGFTFYNGVYYGVAAIPAVIDSAFVLGLTKKLSNGKVPSFPVNAGDGQYIWYCLPTQMGECTFTVGVLPGGFKLETTISFKNSKGHTENYRVYRSVNSGLGSKTVEVS